MKLVPQIALRHLYSPQKGSFTTFTAILAIIGLGLGVAALILTFSILKGFESTISDKIAQFDGHVRIEHFMSRTLDENNPMFANAVNNNSIDCIIIPFVQSPALLRKGSIAEGVITIGIENTDNNTITLILERGSADLHENKIVIGSRLADDMNVELGDKVVLFDMQTIGRISSGQRFKQFEVIGLFHSGLLEYDKTVVYTTKGDAQYLFNANNRVSGYILLTSNSKKIQNLKDYFSEELGYPYFVMTWKDKHKILFDWINIQKWPILIIFGLIAFVGLVNIISSLTMIILEKVREIGTLLSLGISKRNIRRIFLLEGLVIGLLGSFVGALLAGTITFLQNKYQIFKLPEDIYFMSSIPVQVDWFNIIVIIFVGTVAAVIASLWPVYRASRIEPSEALRYE